MKPVDGADARCGRRRRKLGALTARRRAVIHLRKPDPNGADQMAKYVKLQSSYYLDPAVATLSPIAELAFVRSIAYCGAAESHGFVPDVALTSLVRLRDVRATSRIRREIVAATLWIDVPGGVQLRTWDENQPELESLLSRRKSERERQRKHRGKGVDKASGKDEMSRDIDCDLARPREDETREELKHLLPLVRRQLFGDARKSTTTDEDLIWLWSSECGRADLTVELKAWLIHNTGTRLTNPSAALAGWLRSAAKRVAPMPPDPGCGDCFGGWLPDEFGQPSARRCQVCRPHRLRVVGEG